MSRFFQWLKSFDIGKKGEKTVKTDMIRSAGVVEPSVDSTKKKVGFSASYTLGNHLYRSRGEKVSIEFDNEKRGIHKQIIDDSGRILQISLYADNDQDGNFLGPFRIYELGIKRYLLEDK